MMSLVSLYRRQKLISSMTTSFINLLLLHKNNISKKPLSNKKKNKSNCFSLMPRIWLCWSINLKTWIKPQVHYHPHLLLMATYQKFTLVSQSKFIIKGLVQLHQLVEVCRRVWRIKRIYKHLWEKNLQKLRSQVRQLQTYSRLLKIQRTLWNQKKKRILWDKVYRVL